MDFNIIWELIIEQTLSFIYNNHTSQKFNTHFFPQESGSYCLWNVDKKQKILYVPGKKYALNIIEKNNGTGYTCIGDLFFCLSYSVTVIQWTISCHKNLMTAGVVTLWRVHVMSLTVTVYC